MTCCDVYVCDETKYGWVLMGVHGCDLGWNNEANEQGNGARKNNELVRVCPIDRKRLVPFSVMVWVTDRQTDSGETGRD